MCVNKGQMVRKMNNNDLIKVLGRDEHSALLDIKKDPFFKDKKILITGANGSIGTHLIKYLRKLESIIWLQM